MNSDLRAQVQQRGDFFGGSRPLPATSPTPPNCGQ
jgi:hypothetical protein